jgi:hypothetical protein
MWPFRHEARRRLHVSAVLPATVKDPQQYDRYRSYDCIGPDLIEELKRENGITLQSLHDSTDTGGEVMLLDKLLAEIRSAGNAAAVAAEDAPTFLGGRGPMGQYFYEWVIKKKENHNLHSYQRTLVTDSTKSAEQSSQTILEYDLSQCQIVDMSISLVERFLSYTIRDDRNGDPSFGCGTWMQTVIIATYAWQRRPARVALYILPNLVGNVLSRWEFPVTATSNMICTT